MIVDTSVLVAILKSEAGADDLAVELASFGGAILMSASTYLEAGIVTLRGGDEAMPKRLDDLIQTLGIEIVPFTHEQSKIARNAYAKYGRGSGHPARLNFGDCFSYALAKANDEPLLFKGDDFAQTDIRSVLAQG